AHQLMMRIAAECRCPAALKHITRFVVNVDTAVDERGGGRFCEFPDSRPQRVGWQPVVCIEKSNVLTTSIFQRQIPGTAHASVWLMEGLYPAVFVGICLNNFIGLINTSVVDHQQFPVGICLFDN